MEKTFVKFNETEIRALVELTSRWLGRQIIDKETEAILRTQASLKHPHLKITDYKLSNEPYCVIITLE